MFDLLAAIFGKLYQIAAGVHAVLDLGRGILFDGGDYSAEVYLVLTVILGGAGAFAAGRAVASTWKPLVQVPVYAAGLAAAVRFLHYALFEEELLSIHYFLAAFAILAAIALLGFRMMRVNQMVRQYSWAFRRSGLFGWRKAV